MQCIALHRPCPFSSVGSLNSLSSTLLLPARLRMAVRRHAHIYQRTVAMSTMGSTQWAAHNHTNDQTISREKGIRTMLFISFTLPVNRQKQPPNNNAPSKNQELDTTLHICGVGIFPNNVFEIYIVPLASNKSSQYYASKNGI